ncbi:MAG: hypothetical protein ABR569_10090 [Gaiellaceae bacterium]
MPEATAAMGGAQRHLRGLAFVRREWRLLASALIWVVFILNFNSLAIASGDESVQLRFVERLYGDAPNALGYYFGLGLVEAPFYGIGKLLDHTGLHTLAGKAVETATIALGLGLLTTLAWPLLATVIRGLRLPAAGFAILAAAFGTPFFYYATFVPGKNHAIDGLLFAGVIFLAYRYFRSGQPERWLPYALGALFGLACTVRYFNGAEAVALVLVLVWWRRWRHAAEIAATAAAVCLVLFLIPRLLGVSVFSSGNYSTDVVVFAPLNPLRMLFTNHRGYFLWSPVSALAVIGLVLLFRRRPEHRHFLWALTAMSVALMGAYALVPFWDGTWAFGQRFFTPLFPVVAIGLAGLIDAVPRTAVAAATVAAAWSLYLAFNLVIIGGPQYVADTPGGVSDVALIPPRTHTSVGAYLWGLRHKSLLLR